MDENIEDLGQSSFSMRERWLIYWRTWRCKGAAKMSQRLWLHWVFLGRYPAQ